MFFIFKILVEDFKGRSIGVLRNVCLGVKLEYFEDDFHIYAYKYLKKREVENKL